MKEKLHYVCRNAFTLQYLPPANRVDTKDWPDPILIDFIYEAGSWTPEFWVDPEGVKHIPVRSHTLE